MITWENYEEYMVMHADGELTPAQEQELMSFLYEHPELQSELTAFTMTKMIPDTQETYARKTSLLKPEPVIAPVATENTKVIALPVWRRYAVAAGIAAFMLASGYGIYVTNNNTNTTSIATNTPPSALPATPTNSFSLPQKVVAANEVKPSVEETAITATEKPAVPSTSKATRMATTTNNRVPVEYAYAHTIIDPVVAKGIIEFSAEKKNIAPAVTNVPDLAIQYREDDTEREAESSFIDRLPVSDTKKAGMKSLASDAADEYGMVNSIRKEIANANVSVSIKNKKLTFSF